MSSVKNKVYYISFCQSVINKYRNSSKKIKLFVVLKMSSSSKRVFLLQTKNFLYDHKKLWYKTKVVQSEQK